MSDDSNHTHQPAGGWLALRDATRQLLVQRNPLAAARALLRVNQPDGFDCPGCAWPEPDRPGGLEFCENGIKAVAWETTAKRAGPAFFAKHTVTHLRDQSDHWLESQGRLTQPMRYNRTSDRYEPIEWDDAFALIGRRLCSLDEPNEAIFYTSGRTSNEAAFMYQLLARRLGTNNLPDCSNMCHESSGAALGEVIGVGKGSVRLDDFDKADCILVIGQNPGTNHPRMLSVLQKAAQRGATIVSINPLKEPGLQSFLHPQHPVAMITGRATPISSHYYQPLVGGDLALLKGLCKGVVDMGDELLDLDFIAQHTAGYNAFVDDIQQADWAEIVEQSGLSREQIDEIATIYARSERVIVCWAMGLTQHRYAVPTIQMIVNLLLLRGNIGRDGAGVCPVRGHSNVQGDRTVGITEKAPRPLVEGIQRAFGFDPPTRHGYDTVDAIRAMADGRAKVFIAMGGNFAAATPDSAHTAAALARCDLTVHVSTKLNRSHTIVGHDALILPCLGRTERDLTGHGPQRVTVEDSMSQVHASSGTKKPASPHLLSEPAIVAGIATATFDDDAIGWRDMAEDYALIRDRIAETLPHLFRGYNAKINRPGGFYLGNPARERQWNTATGKAQFTVAAIPDLSLPADQLRLMTVRSHDQYNTTVYALNDRYRGVAGTREVIFAHPDDVAALGLREGDRVDVTSHFEDGVERRVRGFTLIAYDVPRGCAAGYFPELNPLVSVDAVAIKSNTPVSKFIPVSLKASHDPID